VIQTFRWAWELFEEWIFSRQVAVVKRPFCVAARQAHAAGAVAGQGYAAGHVAAQGACS
jgi:hypothetical protein